MSVVSCPWCLPTERFGLCLFFKDPLGSYRLQLQLPLDWIPFLEENQIQHSQLLQPSDHRGGLHWIHSSMSVFPLYWGHFWKGSHLWAQVPSQSKGGNSTRRQDSLFLACDQIVLKKFSLESLEILSLENLSPMYCRSMTSLPGPHCATASRLFAEGNFCWGLRCRTVPFGRHGSLLVGPISLLSVQSYLYVWCFVKSDAESQMGKGLCRVLGRNSAKREREMKLFEECEQYSQNSSLMSFEILIKNSSNMRPEITETSPSCYFNLFKVSLQWSSKIALSCTHTT